MNINSLFESAFIRFPDRVAISAGDMDITYSQLHGQITRVTGALRRLGLKAGGRVGFLGRNCAEAAVVYYAVSRLCAVFIPFNYDVTSSELSKMIEIAAPDIFFIGGDCPEVISRLRKHGAHHIISVGKKTTGVTDYNMLLNDDSEYYIEHTSGTELNAILFTSGVTGKPKAVAFSHNNFTRLIYSSSSERIALSGGSDILNVPLFHITGLSCMLKSLSFGRRLIMMRHFVADDWIILADSEMVENAYLPPFFLAEILQSPIFPEVTFKSLCTVVYGGDKMSADTISDALERFPQHVEFIGNYGLTETTFDAAVLSAEDHRTSSGARSGRIASVGRAAPGVSIIVADAQGNSLAASEVGELLIHTDNPMIGYIDPCSHMPVPFNGYWINTEDLGYIDEDGYVFLSGTRLDGLVEIDEDASYMQGCHISVYPTFYSAKRNLQNSQEALMLERASVHVSDLYSVIKSMQKLHASLDIDEIKHNYLREIPHIIKASAYSIHLAPQEDLDRMGDELENQALKWRKPKFKSLPVVCHIGALDDSKDGELARFAESVSLLEFTRQINPVQWVRTPLFTPANNLLGVLSFIRTNKEDVFTQSEQTLMRLVSNHMCIAIVNSLRYARTAEKQRMSELVVKAVGCPIIVSNRDGETLHMNTYAAELFKYYTGAGIAAGLSRNINEINCGALSAIVNPVRVYIKGQAKWFKLKTIRTPHYDDWKEPLYVTAIFHDSDTLDFRCFSDTLSDREIDVLTLVAQGLYNSEIANALNISINTVKFFLKSLFLKFDVSSRTELIIRAYNTYGGKYPFFNFMI